VDLLSDSLPVQGDVGEVVVVVLEPSPVRQVALVFSQPSLLLLLSASGQVCGDPTAWLPAA